MEAWRRGLRPAFPAWRGRLPRRKLVVRHLGIPLARGVQIVISLVVKSMIELNPMHEENPFAAL